MASRTETGGGANEYERTLAEVLQHVNVGLHQADLTPAQRADYGRTMHDLLGYLRPAALRRVHVNVKAFRFYRSHKELTKAIKRKYPQLRLMKGRLFKGMFDKDGSLHSNGAGTLFGRPASIAEFQAHEICHAIDGVDHIFSRSTEWVRVWTAEIKNGGFLGVGSMKTPAEGFSEFGAIVLASGISVERIAEVMPRAVKFWKERGLL